MEPNTTCTDLCFRLGATIPAAPEMDGHDGEAQGEEQKTETKPESVPEQKTEPEEDQEEVDEPLGEYSRQINTFFKP